MGLVSGAVEQGAQAQKIPFAESVSAFRRSPEDTNERINP
jgi:hypothetical protein